MKIEQDITEQENQQGKRLWNKYNHRDVLAKANTEFLSPDIVSFYDHSYWNEFTPTQQKQLLEIMREMELIKKGVCLQCHGNGFYMEDNDYNNNYDEETCSKCDGTGRQNEI